MVYRGKPSAGCESCRKAKKRCGLEQPACQRCVKLKKTCSGYRCTTSLQIQDESESVRRKAERQKPKASSQGQQQRYTTSPKHLAPPTKTDTLAGIPTPGSVSSDSTSCGDAVELERGTLEVDLSSFDEHDPIQSAAWGSIGSILGSLMQNPNDVATCYFFKQFTSNTHWEFMRGYAENRTLDPCLDLAMKACGMAALGNVQDVVRGSEYGRSMYVEALGLLNEALQDPKRCKTDESLIAVAMLGYYENLSCEGRQSIQSWKAHINGATQLLKLRGKAQFKTPVGRILFRETRNQIVINSVWNDNQCPDFLQDYQEELTKYYREDNLVAKPLDDLVNVCVRFAKLRAKVRFKQITDAVAIEEASQLERSFIRWQVDACAEDPRWRYNEMEVEDSEHVWDGRVFSFSEMEREEQMQYFRRTRRRMTDDICSTIPVSLGHASPAFSSPCVLITAYQAVWPLFFAYTCALERVGPGAWGKFSQSPSSLAELAGLDLPEGNIYHAETPPDHVPYLVQAQWILGRLDYISKSVGLRWADGVAATLRGDFRVAEELLREDDIREIQNYTKIERAPWIRNFEDAPRGSILQAEKPSSVSDASTERMAKGQGQGWLGRDFSSPNSPSLDPATNSRGGLYEG
ncbi:hypothetical protein LTR37_002713 [Vermiconidia calcicola]|uniref:Uncharacterized protein n=1 Tax=Vermiconidia calcicola TaxID=1690605 RepID=A0ACC3NRK0_9PEZI|nr:hypothetical protein LTR37_002713 [Vermiconidia calcicola]